jgi:hypothetical protein
VKIRSCRILTSISGRTGNEMNFFRIITVTMYFTKKNKIKENESKRHGGQEIISKRERIVRC